jgi:MFS transporter, ACS family, hexuronate transporter
MMDQIAKPKASHFRWVICALLFWVTTANYIDRSVFGNLAPEMPKYLHLADKITPSEITAYAGGHAAELSTHNFAQYSPGTDANANTAVSAYIRSKIARSQWDKAYWNMQMVFSAAFALSMLVMGRVMDLFGLRWGFVFACGFWGVAAMLHALAPEIGGLFGNPLIGFFICRFLLGFGEGGNMPAAIKTTAEWFPKRERALATGLFNSGANVGGLLVPWLLPWLIVQFSALTIGPIVVGWRGTFIITGVFDLCWIAAWLAFYKKPSEHPSVSASELEFICEGHDEPAVKIPWRKLLPHKQTWAIVIACALTDCFWSFYLFATPDLFNRRFGLTPDGRKYLIMTILVVTSVGSIAGGWLSGKLMQRGWSINRARKVTLLICALCTVPVFYACITTNKWACAVLIMIAASGHQAWKANVLSLVGDMFPKRVVGSVVGFSGMVAAIGMMILFYFTGKVLSVTGNYLPVFVLASVCYVLALVFVHAIVPRLEIAKIEEATRLASDYSTAHS